ncbi:hypothetical protein BX666DRAFT_86055 [Dichotomocladium elegans]|nr:hypothetical protein BX666DRAFT_86055 [Dichotomocladium elegans]
MDMLMRQLMGVPNDMDSIPNDADNTPEEEEKGEKEDVEEEEEEAFAFRLFSSKPVTQVNIKEKEEEDAKRLAELVAAVTEQRPVDYEKEKDPEFKTRVAAAAVDYDTIMAQSHWDYPAMRYPRRVMNISTQQQQQQAGDEKSKRKRKSKKRRDFEKAVREGRIKVLPNKRNPSTPGGWPGWPGHRTRCAIITDLSKVLKKRPYTPGGRGE